MKFKAKLLLASFFIVFGFLLIGPLKSPTGAVIGLVSVSHSFLGIISLLFGVLFLALVDDKKKRIEDIVKSYESGDISEIEAVKELNEIVQIKNVRYREEKQHSLVGERDIYSVHLKSGKKAENLALVEYLVAGKNNPSGARFSNLEFRKGLSTKHYMVAFRKLVLEYKKEHKKELEDILGVE